MLNALDHVVPDPGPALGYWWEFGRAEVGRGLIGPVNASLDGGDAWSKADNWNQDAPLIFGLSGASGIATSVSEQSVGSAVINLDPATGDASTATRGTAVNRNSASVETGSPSRSASDNPYTAFEFDGGNTYPGQDCLGVFHDGDLRIEVDRTWRQPGNLAQLLGTGIDDVTQVPATGFAVGAFPVAAGQVHAFSAGIPYKYQPNGSCNFRESAP